MIPDATQTSCLSCVDAGECSRALRYSYAPCAVTDAMNALAEAEAIDLLTGMGITVVRLNYDPPMTRDVRKYVNANAS